MVNSFSVVRLLTYRAWLIVSAVVLLSLSVRFRLRDMPLERDEGEYAYAGQLMLEGIPPYKLAYNMKLPGTYAAYAVIMAIFGQTPSGIHFGVSLVNAASVILMFLLGRKLLDEITGIVAAIVFGLLTLSPASRGLAGHATHFVVLPALAGTLLLVRAVESKELILKKARGNARTGDFPGENCGAEHSSRITPHSSPSPLSQLLRRLSTPHYQLFFSGLLFGLAFLMKQHGVFFGICGGLFLLSPPISQRLIERAERKKNYGRLPKNAESFRSMPWSAVLTQIAVYSAGCLLPYALTCLILWVAGVFPQFWFWTISYAAKYASPNSMVGSPSNSFRAAIQTVLKPDLVLWILPCLGALIATWEARLKMTHRVFVALLIVFSLMAVCVGFYFRPHYFIVLFPILSLLTGVAVSRSLFLVKWDRTIELFLGVPVLAGFLIGTIASVLGHGSLWFSLSPVQAVREIYGTTLFTEARNVASIVHAHVPKGHAIAVLGSEPEIYFYSHRHSATSYIYMYPLAEVQLYALRMQAEVIDQLTKNSADLVVFVDDYHSWLFQENSEQKLLDWWRSYSADNFDLISAILLQDREDEHVPGVLNSENSKKVSEADVAAKRLLIFERKNPN